MWHRILRIIEIIVGISAAAGMIAGIVQLFEKKSVHHKPKGIYERFFKRTIDVFLSTGALIVLSPIIGITALLVRIKHGSPVVYVQERPGRDEKIFKIYKFRTMTNETDSNGELLPDEERLTKLGSFLRSASIDEILELINIIKGDMSIIGPRPLLVSYLKYYTDEERHRHDVRPGLTGYAQVHGRNYVTWEDKFKMDVNYVNNITFKTDLKILLDTVMVVFKKENIETASKIVHDGVTYQPLDVERRKLGEEVDG